MKKKLNTLSSEEQQVILEKGTERPFSGKYNDSNEEGVYTCKQCDTTLFHSEHKFLSHCGWPSFDDEIPGAIKRQADADGLRTEILCAQCDGHLGHVFEGEMLTSKNLRHCVNSISMNFVSADELAEKTSSELCRAYFAGGCFWGVEHLMQQQSGVVEAVSGYMGGYKNEPSYHEVCAHTTGHLEVVEVSYRPQEVDYETLAKLFFEIHDPTQCGGQGPDFGEQYASVIFYNDEAEKAVALGLIDTLKSKGFEVVTELRPLSTFWRAEEYHQDYYARTRKVPYCHSYQPRF